MLGRLSWGGAAGGEGRPGALWSWLAVRGGAHPCMLVAVYSHVPLRPEELGCLSQLRLHGRAPFPPLSFPAHEVSCPEREVSLAPIPGEAVPCLSRTLSVLVASELRSYRQNQE